jgi:transcription elongation factor GreB
MARGWGKEDSPSDLEAHVARYKAPQVKSSPYITPEGYARLKDEYHQLYNVRRPEVVRALSAAAAEGDRSENAAAAMPAWCWRRNRNRCARSV